MSLEKYRMMLQKMSNMELRKEKEKNAVSIANHFREWYDAIGTCFEIEDKREKLQRRNAIFAEMKYRRIAERI